MCYGNAPYAGRTDGVELTDLLNPYTKNSQIWFCPSIPLDTEAHMAPDPSWTYGRIGTSYQYNLFTGYMIPMYFPGHILGGTPVDAAVDISNAPIVWDDPCWGSGALESWLTVPHDGGINVLIADGHAKWYAVPAMEMWSCDHSEDGWFN
jgi:prepilin-type processing-associated H-X9-DG protein